MAAYLRGQKLRHPTQQPYLKNVHSKSLVGQGNSVRSVSKREIKYDDVGIYISGKKGNRFLFLGLLGGVGGGGSVGLAFFLPGSHRVAPTLRPFLCICLLEKYSTDFKYMQI